MTAYVSRLFPRPGSSAGIRKRPRSRYEPEPETYLGHAPGEFDMEPTNEEPSADRTPTNHAYRRHAAEPAATPNVVPKPAPRQTLSAPARPTAPPDQHDADQLAGPDNHQLAGPGVPHPPAPTLGAEAAVRTEPADAVPASPASISDTPAGRIIGEHRQSEYVAVPVHSAIPPAPTGELGQEQSAYPRREGRQSERRRTPAAVEPAVRATPGTPSEPHTEPNIRLTQPAASPIQPSDTPARADLSAPDRSPTLSAADRSATPDPIRASRLPRPNAKSPDPAVRQKVTDAIAEPVRVQNTEVVVSIDRIDVRAPANDPPAPPAPRRARAAPTSLESYLRSRSRRGGR